MWILAAFASERTDGQDAEAAMDFAGALAHYRACVVNGEDRDRRYCSARIEVLEPQAADDFSGWRVLAEARRNPADAEAPVRAAIAAGGPATDDLRAWLARTTGDLSMAPKRDAAWVAEERATAEERRRREWIAAISAGMAGIYGVAAIAGSGAWRWRSAAAAVVLLGVTPAAMAAIWEWSFAPEFVVSASVVGMVVLAAGRAHVAVAVPGAIGAMSATAWWNGWY